jgi:Fe-S-cluster containining protein
VDLINNIGLERAIEGTYFETNNLDLNIFLHKDAIFPFVFDDTDRKGFMYFLALKRVDSEIFPGTQKCHFLTESKRTEPLVNNNLPNHSRHPGSRYSSECSIMGNRPLACTTYPLIYNFQSQTMLLKRREDFPQMEQHEAYKLCPKDDLLFRDFGKNSPKEIASMRDDMHLAVIRNQMHNEIATRWNSQPFRSINTIVPFLMGAVSSSISVALPPIKITQRKDPSQEEKTEEIKKPKMGDASQALKRRKKPSKDES